MDQGSPREQWLHDLRNAVNTAGMSIAVARRLIEAGEIERGLGFLAEVETACDRCRLLINQHGNDGATP
jgi:hypothetical protein